MQQNNFCIAKNKILPIFKNFLAQNISQQIRCKKCNEIEHY